MESKLYKETVCFGFVGNDTTSVQLRELDSIKRERQLNSFYISDNLKPKLDDNLKSNIFSSKKREPTY